MAHSLSGLKVVRKNNFTPLDFGNNKISKGSIVFAEGVFNDNDDITTDRQSMSRLNANNVNTQGQRRLKSANPNLLGVHKIRLDRPSTSQTSFSRQLMKDIDNAPLTRKESMSKFYKDHLKKQIEQSFQPIGLKTSKTIAQLLQPQIKPEKYFHERVEQIYQKNIKGKDEEDAQLLDDIVNKKVRRTFLKYIKDNKIRRDYLTKVISKIKENQEKITNNFSDPFNKNLESVNEEKYLSKFMNTQDFLENKKNYRRRILMQSMHENKYGKLWSYNKSSELSNKKLMGSTCQLIKPSSGAPETGVQFYPRKNRYD
ncbi:UNKNOWN [Stylonychia lemnae]|uniref:Uncharacterized protein n=1 Tax=Stylonychia lemnae TaxID=5949 RepID=A0A077ZTB9_STYLE|nr:UNKNOWN [Stylonychia lemnae]|eukprot:CDW71706.1 UNKNOWN [Stylonychia lemnae]